LLVIQLKLLANEIIG